MQDDKKIALFENTPVPKAVAQLAIPTIISSLVMVIYNLADTYFVGMGKESLLFAVMRKIVLEIPALYLLNNLFPLYGLAYAQFTAEVVLAAAAMIVLVRLFRRLENSEKTVPIS